MKKRKRKGVIVTYTLTQHLTFKHRHGGLHGTGSCHIFDIIEIRDEEMITDILEAVNTGRGAHQTLHQPDKQAGNIWGKSGKVFTGSLLRKEWRVGVSMGRA